ncbi:hypothetical protein PUR30_01950, partial [Streptomyces sp. JV190]|nr:hypothetical protein [Streptomyces sp. JV190]
MKAISYSAYGGADVLEYGERPDPKVGPDTVLVKVRAAARGTFQGHDARHVCPPGAGENADVFRPSAPDEKYQAAAAPVTRN